jgi:hypothetical protein
VRPECPEPRKRAVFVRPRRAGYTRRRRTAKLLRVSGLRTRRASHVMQNKTTRGLRRSTFRGRSSQRRHPEPRLVRGLRFEIASPGLPSRRRMAGSCARPTSQIDVLRSLLTARPDASVRSDCRCLGNGRYLAPSID